METTQTGYVNIDTAAPTTTDDAPVAWQNTATTVTLTPTANGGSAIASTSYKVDDGSYTTGAAMATLVPVV